MTTNIYSKFGSFYRASMSLSGFNRALSRYIKGIDMVSKSKPYILEVGAGPSPISPSFLERFPDATLIITDSDEGFLDIISKKFNTLIQSGTMQVKKVNINSLYRTEVPSQFDIIIAGGVLGYSKSLLQTIRNVSTLLKNGGVFIMIEMSPNLLGPIFSMIYDYRLPKAELIRELLEDSNFKDIKIKKISAKYFPLNLSRQFIMAQKLI